MEHAPTIADVERSAKSLSVLLLEDSEFDAELTVTELRRANYDVVFERVQSADEMKAALRRSSFDLILSDYQMPSFSAPDALDVLRQLDLDLPFIILSGTIGEDTAVSALKAGADDFMVKGRLARLAPAIERELRDRDRRRAHRNAEEALRISESQFRSLVEHAVFGIYQARIDGQLLAVNPALVTMLGYESVEDLLSVRLKDLYANPAERHDLARRCLINGTLSAETVWKRKDGTELRVRLSGRCSNQPKTGTPLFDVIVEDITEQHRLQQQLRQAQRMEAIGQLAGGIAHDFNNMLTAILGYTELLTEQIGPDKPIGRDLRQIQAAAERASALTRHLLAFSRKQVLSITAINLSDVVTKLEPVLRRLLGERIVIATEPADALEPVMADAMQLEHVIVNLCINARDAMPDGGTLRIRTRNVDLDSAYARAHLGAKPGAYAALEVSDTGVGMTPDVQARIFEPFFTTKEVGRGTGLGLAAVFGTVKQLHGYIDVSSRVGFGTTFTIFLPRTSEAVVPAPEAAIVSSPVGTETILVAEDEAGVRAFVTQVLQRYGYTVLQAESGEAALAGLRSHSAPIHLLLTDVGLPGMNGAELGDHAQRERPDILCLYMSGYADRLTAADGALSPNVQLLVKPFTAHALLTKVRDVLGPAVS